MRRLVSIVSAVLLFTALLKLPIGYYTLLRIVVTGSAFYLAYNVHSVGKPAWQIVVWCLIGVLFNPVLPIYLGTRAAWAPVDVVIGILFLIEGFRPDRSTQT